MTDNATLGPRVEGARGDEMRERMQARADAGTCVFCDVVGGDAPDHASPIFLGVGHWVATYNDFPYAGTDAHVLILSRYHVMDLRELPVGALTEFLPFCLQVAEKLGLTGYCPFGRIGDRNLTAQTIPHLHFHVTQSDGLPVVWESVDEDMKRVIEDLPDGMADDSDALKRLWGAIDLRRSFLDGKATGVYPKLSNKAIRA